MILVKNMIFRHFPIVFYRKYSKIKRTVIPPCCTWFQWLIFCTEPSLNILEAWWKGLKGNLSFTLKWQDSQGCASDRVINSSSSSGLLYYASCLYFATFAKSVFCVRFLTTICNLRTIKNCILRNNFSNYLYFASFSKVQKLYFASFFKDKIVFCEDCIWRKIQIVPAILTQNTAFDCSQITKYR